MVTAVARFADLAPRYDAARPQAPAELAEVLMQWSGRSEPDVVDVGAGTGLSTVIWVGRARQVTAVEPGDRMRAVALGRRRLRDTPNPLKRGDARSRPEWAEEERRRRFSLTNEAYSVA